MKNEKQIDLIDRNSLIDWLSNPIGFLSNCEDCTDIDCLDCIIEEAIKNAPTVDAEPAKHGRWGGEEIFPGFPTLNGYFCSNCRKRAGRKTNYCPNCGAKMDEEVQ